jgi:hypothetical protein
MSVKQENEYVSRPTREEIVQKMNYAPPSDYEILNYRRDFQIGLRRILAKAITCDRTEDYAAYFGLHDVTDEWCSGDYECPYGEKAGEIAAVRWLAEEDRSAAEDFFPMLDS